MNGPHAPETRRTGLLAIETATSETIVAVQARSDAVVVADRWPAGHAHGERLLSSVERVLDLARVELDDLAVIAVGTGPGSFTGLRIGLAAAKGLAFGLGLPIVGVPTAETVARALDLAAPGPRAGHDPEVRFVVMQPAGPAGRYRTPAERDAEGRWRTGPSEMLTVAEGKDEGPAVRGTTIAIDLLDVTDEAAGAGRSAREHFPEALVDGARERVAAGVTDDLAALVPAYVSPPRGAAVSQGSIRWSRARP